MTLYTATIAGPDGAVTHTIDRELVIGRGDVDLVVEHSGVSRRHATIAPGDGYCVVTDLDSSNGTFINEGRITVPTMARPGDVVRFGQAVTLTVAIAATVRPNAPAGVGSETMAETATPAGAPALADTEALQADGLEVRYIPKSAGRKAAKSMLDAARRAKKRLAGFGSEPGGHTVVIHLIDPVQRDGMLITSGTIIDTESRQLWCIVSSESRPEDPTRAMALIYGASLPAADALENLIGGYGLQLSGQHDAAPAIWSELEEPAKTQVAAAFMHHLVEQHDDETVRAFLSAPPDAIDATARDLFGKSTTQLIRSWIANDSSDYKPGQFVRLAFRRLWPYKTRQLEVFVYMLLSLAFTSVYPFATRHLFDEVIPSGEFSRVWQLLILLAGAFVISLLAGVRRQYQSTYISASVVKDLRQEMFDRAQRLSSSSLSNYQQGEVLSRMFQDVGQLQSGLSAMINTGIFQTVSLVVSGVIMLSVNLWLGLLVVVGAPIIAIVYRMMGEGAQKRSLAVQKTAPR